MYKHFFKRLFDFCIALVDDRNDRGREIVIKTSLEEIEAH